MAVRYDADKPEGDALARRMGVRGYPAFAVLDSSGRVLDEFAGHRSAEDLVQRLRSRPTR